MEFIYYSKPPPKEDALVVHDALEGRFRLKLYNKVLILFLENKMLLYTY